MKKFYEIDVTNFEKAQLIKIYRVLHGDHGWGKHIDNLEMIVDEYDRIIVRGWATKKRWQRFLNALVYDTGLNDIKKILEEIRPCYK